MAIRVMYSIFLGLLVACFIGFGIAAFYPAPKTPEYPVELEVPKTVGGQPVELTAEEKALQEEYREASKEYNEIIRPRYERNVSLIALTGAIAVMIISLTALNQIKLLSDGLLLGGVMALIYAIIRGFMANESVYSFLVVSVGLLVALVLGYIKFTKGEVARK